MDLGTIIGGISAPSVLLRLFPCVNLNIDDINNRFTYTIMSLIALIEKLRAELNWMQHFFNIHQY